VTRETLFETHQRGDPERIEIIYRVAIAPVHIVVRLIPIAPPAMTSARFAGGAPSVQSRFSNQARTMRSHSRSMACSWARRDAGRSGLSPLLLPEEPLGIVRSREHVDPTAAPAAAF
jgi:hypothetical protein